MHTTQESLVDAAPHLTLREYTWRWLFDPTCKDGMQPQVDAFIGLLIVASVFAIILEHNPAIYQPLATQFHWFDVITVAIFSGAAANDAVADSASAAPTNIFLRLKDIVGLLLRLVLLG